MRACRPPPPPPPHSCPSLPSSSSCNSRLASATVDSYILTSRWGGGGRRRGGGHQGSESEFEWLLELTGAELQLRPSHPTPFLLFAFCQVLDAGCATDHPPREEEGEKGERQPARDGCGHGSEDGLAPQTRQGPQDAPSSASHTTHAHTPRRLQPAHRASARRRRPRLVRSSLLLLCVCCVWWRCPDVGASSLALPRPSATAVRTQAPPPSPAPTLLGRLRAHGCQQGWLPAAGKWTAWREV